MPRGSPGTPTVTPIGRAAGGAPPSVLGGPITIGVMSAAVMAAGALSRKSRKVTL